MKDFLTNLNQSTDGIQASVIFSVDGVLLASTLPHDTDPDEVGAIVAAIHSLGGKTANLLHRGSLKRIQVQSNRGNMFVSALGESALLVVLTNSHVNIGLLLHEIRRLEKQAAEKDWFVGESS